MDRCDWLGGVCACVCTRGGEEKVGEGVIVSSGDGGGVGRRGRRRG